VFLSEFLDEKDSGTAILSHFYLLTGCAVPLWLERYESVCFWQFLVVDMYVSPSRVLGLAGVIVLGVGDALVRKVGET
jgi:dolichol kinase